MDAKIYNFMGNAFFSSPAVLGNFLIRPDFFVSSQQRLPPPLFFLNPRPKSRSYADIPYLYRLPFMTSSFPRCISCPCDTSYLHTLSAFAFQLDVSLMYLYLFRRFICSIKGTAQFLPTEYSRAAPVTLSPISLRTRLERKSTVVVVSRLSS